MHIIRLSIVIASLIFVAGRPDTTESIAGVSFPSGAILHFHRKFTVLGTIPVKYVHKGILFYPGICSCPFTEDSSGNKINIDRPYVIHLWAPGMSKRKSTVRIDPLEEVIQGDKVTVIPDSGPGVLSCDAAVARAFSQFGLKHRGLRYNLAGNNCGNFVAWAKYGDSERDVQFWDRTKRIVSKVLPGVGPKGVGVVSRIVRRYYKHKESLYHH